VSYDEVVWRALTKKDRPLWRRLSAQTLAQADVHAPDGTLYWVRIARNAPVKVSGGSDLGAVADVAMENLRLMGETGWAIKVLQPSTHRAPRELFRQVVHARPIVVDIAFVIVEAIRRGDRLWDDD
jgi:hypothetical protein